MASAPHHELVEGKPAPPFSPETGQTDLALGNLGGISDSTSKHVESLVDVEFASEPKERAGVSVEVANLASYAKRNGNTDEQRRDAVT